VRYSACTFPSTNFLGFLFRIALSLTLCAWIRFGACSIAFCINTIVENQVSKEIGFRCAFEWFEWVYDTSACPTKVFRMMVRVWQIWPT
jgi:hypothetical protein